LVGREAEGFDDAPFNRMEGWGLRRKMTIFIGSTVSTRAPTDAVRPRYSVRGQIVGGAT
jgi:hypothetical protein